MDNDEDINLWKLEIEGKLTAKKKPLSGRRKNMSLDVLCQILRLAKRRGLANDKLLIDARPFKNLGAGSIQATIRAYENRDAAILLADFWTTVDAVLR